MVFAVPSIIERLFFNSKKRDKKVRITAVNVKFMGVSHALAGLDVAGREAELKIPFQNKMGNNLLPDNLKGPKAEISKISVMPPFTLESVSPALPVQVEFMSRVVFTIRIGVPDMSYEGPLQINFGNEAANSITISIRKVTLHRGDRHVELEESGVTSSMQKSQLFRQNVQAYKILSFGDQVKNIVVNKPFEIVSTDPKLPLVADRKDSYIISLYMKCPEFNYAGDMDINFS